MPDDKAQRNFTDPDSRDHARPGRSGLPAVLQLPGGGGQLPPGHCGGSGHRPTLGQAAGGSHGGGDHRQRGRGAERSIRRRRVLLGQGGGWAIRPGSGPVRRAGEDPPRPGVEPAPRGRIPKGLSPRDRMRRKLRRSPPGATRSGWRRWNRCSARSSSRGFRQFAAGPGES